jgi:hypothetical protein
VSYGSTPPRDWTLVLRRAVCVWLPIATGVSGLALIVYVAVQQDLRLTADDAQIALAQSTAARLDNGTLPADAIPADPVDVTDSLEPFVMVFDTGGQLIASSATLNANPVDYPAGVFDTVRVRGQDRVTWQPISGIRDATVAIPWRGGFVVAGRSLRLTEGHIDQIGLVVAAGWVFTLVLVGVVSLLVVVYVECNRGRLSSTARGWPDRSSI